MAHKTLVEKLEPIQHSKAGLGAIFFTFLLIITTILFSVFISKLSDSTSTKHLESEWILGWIEIGVLAVFIIIGHEIIHAIGFLICGKVGIRAIRFGIDLTNFNVFCGITVPATIKTWRIVLILPLIISILFSMLLLSLSLSTGPIALVGLTIGICHKDLFLLYLLRQYKNHLLMIIKDDDLEIHNSLQ